ncbi:MAG: ABC transporter permease [Bauldia sp.]|nr:MAG: ABC transporter permease [Bauldia sp.]MBZ0230108.1 ABC transporter permease [Bauldia sp.]
MNLELLGRYGPRMLEGLLVTIELVTISVVLGGLLAIPVALARLSRSPLLRGASFGYVYFFRGTPLLAQLFLIYYGSGQFRPFFDSIGLWWFFRDAFLCALLAFTLNTAAYQAEILRGAIRSVPHGQVEAALSLGLRPQVIFLKVVLPQALIVALRPLGNEVILMVKGSAVAAIVTVFDLMGATRLAFARSFDLSVYLWAAILYLAVVETLRRVWDRLEHRLTRHLRPVQP